MEIKSATKTYKVNIESDFDELKKITYSEDTYTVIDKKLYEIYRDQIFMNVPTDRLYILESLETNKTIETALEICERMTDLSAKRNARLISFGGGIVQDVTGFVANILYRGIHWTFFPTTLLSACDSCIGGKTSLNYKKYKNLLGTFYPPDQINICTPFFETLSDRDFKSGLGEVVKFNLMQGMQGLENMENSIEDLLNRDNKTIAKFVKSSLSFKKEFIEEDEFDKGRRIQLNFAHTFGHAFETVTEYEVPHGTAVAMGTICANRVSWKRGILNKDHVDRMDRVLQRIIKIDKSKIDLNIDKILDAIHKDKKQVGKDLTAVLMDEDDELLIVHDVKQEEIKDAVAHMLEII